MFAPAAAAESAPSLLDVYGTEHTFGVSALVLGHAKTERHCSGMGRDNQVCKAFERSTIFQGFPERRHLGARKVRQRIDSTNLINVPRLPGRRRSPVGCPMGLKYRYYFPSTAAGAERRTTSLVGLQGPGRSVFLEKGVGNILSTLRVRSPWSPTIISVDGGSKEMRKVIRFRPRQWPRAMCSPSRTLVRPNVTVHYRSFNQRFPTHSFKNTKRPRVMTREKTRRSRSAPAAMNGR